jgi:hypothetical protein
MGNNKAAGIISKFLIIFLFSTMCLGGTITCSGTVDKLGLHASDKIMLKLSTMNRAVFICSPSYDWEVGAQSIKPALKRAKVCCLC